MACDLATQPLAQRKYLTHAELEQRFGADEADMDAVEQYAHEHDLTVAHRDAHSRTLVLRGRLGDLLSAFHADLGLYHHASGTYRGRRGAIEIPAHLEGIISGVFGFDTRPKRRAPRRIKQAAVGPGAGKGVSPATFADRYSFPEKTNGANQTIAIIELGGGYRQADLQLYFQEIGVPMPAVTAVAIDHARNSPGNADSADGEVMLDIEVAAAVAPAARIVVYFAPNAGDRGLLDAISAAVHDKARQPSVISISWGGPEDFSDQQALDNFHQVFAAAAALGITVCAASGDHGTADLDDNHWDQKIHVDHPASDDLVLGCGGTQIDNGEDVVWNDGNPFGSNQPGGGGWTTGGGISVAFPVPSYQQQMAMPVSLETKRHGRGVPDIAMSATNYFVRVDGYEGPSGGTSAVAPLMAGLVVRINQAANKRVGFLNPFLYANAAKVTCAVVKGDNSIQNGPAGYSAGPGWNACTGLGTPNGKAILSLL